MSDRQVLPPELSSSEKKIVTIVGIIYAFLTSVCCFSSVVLVFFGFSTVSFATTLSHLLYHQYPWLFLLVVLLFILVSISWYFYVKKNVFTSGKLCRQINVLLIYYL
ncbi:MAG: hypothetical protein ACFFE8_12490 [Candidatus Heimdallarchaeota archaeon]